jgi:hypothetical protein
VISRLVGSLFKKVVGLFPIVETSGLLGKTLESAILFSRANSDPEST